MDIKDFVSESLKMIIDGILDAQDYVKGKDRQIQIVPGLMEQYRKKISFDIAVSATEGKQSKGKGGIAVMSIGASMEGQSESTNSTVSRIKFDIPVDLPTAP